MPRKRWIDKSTAQTYQLLYRAQDDPLIHDAAAAGGGERALFAANGGGSSHAQRAPPSSYSHSRFGEGTGTRGGAGEGLHIADLEGEVDLQRMRENEGEAAQYGVYFDDTEYDYMQHLRDLGDGVGEGDGGAGGAGEGRFVDALPVNFQGKGKWKGKGKMMRLEDALAQVGLEDEHEGEDRVPSLVDGGGSRYGGDAYSSFSAATRDRGVERQQNVPDEIAGFQPDMDPRLREVLEALEDDAYVDEKDVEDVFGSLGRDGGNGELTLDEFEYDYGGTYDEDDDGWESDVTEIAPHQPNTSKPPPPQQQPQAKQLHLPDGQQPTATPISTNNEFSVADAEAAATAAQTEDGGDDWLADFAKYKRDAAAATNKKTTPNQQPPAAASSIIAASAVQDRAPTLYTLNGTPLRAKKRKGAQTNPSAYSMTSSSLARTDGQQLLDARFDNIEKLYSLDEDDEYLDGDDDNDRMGGMSLMSGMTGKSKMSALSGISTSSFADDGAVRGDLEGMMDGFLGEWEKANPGGSAGYRGPGAGSNKKRGKRGKNGNERFGLQQLEEVRRELGPARLKGRVGGKAA